MTVRHVVDMFCRLAASCLFYLIETFITPHITVEGAIYSMMCFLTLPILIMNLFVAILPSFTNYRNTITSTTTGCCASGRHGRRGRHTNRHHTWWTGSPYRKKNNNKDDSPKKQYRKRNKQERDMRRKIDLLQYFDPPVRTPDMFVIDDDVFYDAGSIYYKFLYDEKTETGACTCACTDPFHSLQQHPFQGPATPIKSVYERNKADPAPTNYTASSDAICNLVNSIDVLSHYECIASLQDVSFFNSTYRRLNPSSNLFQSILIQARHLKSHVFHYDATSTTDTELTTAIYISSCKTELPIVIDTGASNSITPIPSDFVNGIIHKADLQALSQVNGTTPVCGQGPVEWPIEDVDGNRRTITTDAYYVPDAGIRLFSPQVYINKHKSANMQIDHNGIRFTLKCGTVLRFPFNKSNNLPFMLTEKSLRSRKDSHLSASAQLFTTQGIYTSLIDRSVLNRDNFNLNPAQQELLTWHCRWCHCDLNRVRMILARPRQPKQAEATGELVRQMVVSSESGTSTCQTFCCTACLYAKQKRKTPDSSTETKNKDLEGLLTNGDLNPGDKVSCDQYMSPSKGRLMHTKGLESSSEQYVGGTIFIDHATNYLFANHQVNLTAASTVESKHLCESKFDEFGVQIKQYAADNHPFRSKPWVNDCSVQLQLPTKHSGVGAHHQILAERQIQTTFNWSRANLLHFVLHWPQMAKNRDNLWPYAIDYAVYIHNHLPIRDNRLSPNELFTGTVFNNYNHLTRAHVFGCPVYVLDPRLQDAKKIPKWSVRSRRGIYLGVSKHHSSTVNLVLNPETGTISPQYHCVFDDTFSTVWADGNFDPVVWENLIRNSNNTERHYSTDPDRNGNVTLPPDFVPFSQDIEPDSHRSSPSETIDSANNNNDAKNNNQDKNNSNIDSQQTTTNPAPASSPSSPLLSRQIFSPTPSRSPESSTSEEPRRSTRSNFGTAPTKLDPSTHYSNSEQYCQHLGIKLPTVSRGRTTSQGGCLKTSYSSQKQTLPKVKRNQLNSHYLTCLNWSILLNVCHNNLTTLAAFSCEVQKNITYENGKQLLDYFNPALLVTVANQEDNPTLKEAMNGPDAAGFMKAMEIELDTLITMKAFKVIDKKPWMNVVSSVWAFKRKRYPDGSIRKLKARICARGFEQIEGVDYFETFAPVVQWMTVRIVLIMTILLNLENKQIDYTAAFLQAPLDHDVYVEMPKLFQVKGKVWKLQRAIYGLKDAPRAYFIHTKNKLEELGFRQSDADPCLFISPTVICLIYVDDALFVYKSPEEVDILTKRMKGLGMLFNEESDVAGYLGVLLDRDPDNNTITLRQSGLSQRIVEALHLDDETSSVRTPADSYLPIDEEGEPAHELYNYASVAGMLQYLQGHSRPDISFAVSQISRYTFNPKRSHELALERIGRYLKGTIEKGLILKPNLNDTIFSIDVYVDAAFASGWGTELGTNPDSVKSRTGYIVEVMGCSVIWCSKLQPCIATSTMESEYTALSMALRAAIPLLDVTAAINKGLDFTATRLLKFKATVHEDNMGALRLAQLEPGQHTPRSKFYALKLHWFRSWLKPRDIEVIYCPTIDQKADFLTKPLGPTLFEACRFLSMGW
jgi:hypothetical protein